MNRKLLFFIFISVISLQAQDTLILKSGYKLVGFIVSESPNTLSFCELPTDDLNSSYLLCSKDEITSIKKHPLSESAKKSLNEQMKLRKEAEQYAKNLELSRQKAQANATPEVEYHNPDGNVVSIHISPFITGGTQEATNGYSSLSAPLDNKFGINAMIKIPFKSITLSPFYENTTYSYSQGMSPTSKMSVHRIGCTLSLYLH